MFDYRIIIRAGDVVRVAPNELVFWTPQAYTGKSITDIKVSASRFF
jgi:hypothetical protein